MKSFIIIVIVVPPPRLEFSSSTIEGLKYLLDTLLLWHKAFTVTRSCSSSPLDLYDHTRKHCDLQSLPTCRVTQLLPLGTALQCLHTATLDLSAWSLQPLVTVVPQCVVKVRFCVLVWVRISCLSSCVLFIDLMCRDQRKWLRVSFLPLETWMVCTQTQTQTIGRVIGEVVDIYSSKGEAE